MNGLHLFFNAIRACKKVGQKINFGEEYLNLYNFEFQNTQTHSTWVARLDIRQRVRAKRIEQKVNIELKKLYENLRTQSEIASRFINGEQFPMDINLLREESRKTYELTIDLLSYALVECGPYKLLSQGPAPDIEHEVYGAFKERVITWLKSDDKKFESVLEESGSMLNNFKKRIEQQIRDERNHPELEHMSALFSDGYKSSKERAESMLRGHNKSIRELNNLLRRLAD